MKTLFILCTILSIPMPVIWEVSNDATGDSIRANNKSDMLARVAFIVGSAMLQVAFLNKTIWESGGLTLAFFFFTFDYAVAYVLIRKGVVDRKINDWFSYLSGKKWFDSLMAKMAPNTRFLVKLTVLVVALAFYFIKI